MLVGLLNYRVYHKCKFKQIRNWSGLVLFFFNLFFHPDMAYRDSSQERCSHCMRTGQEFLGGRVSEFTHESANAVIICSSRSILIRKWPYKERGWISAGGR